MKRTLRILALLCLSAIFLTVSALADSGPEDLLTVKVENAPEEGYYLDLVLEGEYEGHTYGSGESEYSGIDWSYSDEEAAALDTELLDALRAAVPEGYHACTAEGTGGAPMWGELEGTPTGRQGEYLHTFRYFGVPNTYQILIATAGGDTYLFPPCTRTALQSSVTVDWADKSVTVPPVWVSYVIQLLCTLGITLVIEGGLLILFGFGKTKRNRMVFLLVNCITQGGLALYSAYVFLHHGVSGWTMIPMILAETVILIVETLAYRRLLTGQTRARAAAYGALANLCSAILGLYLMAPVWQFIISIL